MATFCKGLSVCHLFSKNLKAAPFQSPPGQMAAFVSVLEVKAKDAGTAKNDHKQVETRSHSMIRRRPAQHCSLRGLSPRPMAHKTIALTTELKGTLHAGAKLAPLGPGKQRDGAWPLFAKVCQFVTSCVLLNKAARRRLAFPRVSKNLKVAPFQSPPGQMAAFVSVLEAKAKKMPERQKTITSR